MKCYFAHPTVYYNGHKKQTDALNILKELGWKDSEIINPDSKIHTENYKKGSGMNYFMELVDKCAVLFFIRFDNGKIGAGVAKEIEQALGNDSEVYDISDGIIKLYEKLDEKDVLSVDETRNLIKSIRENNEKG